MNESQQTLQPASYDDEIDLRELFRVLWAGKWLIGGITSAVTVIAIIVALMLPNIYRAEALLAPSNLDGAGGLSALAAQYGGLASLVGIDLGTDAGTDIMFGLEILQSRKFISEFVERHDILVPLMAAKGWDSETDTLEIDSDDFDTKSNRWVRTVWPPKKIIPTNQEAYEEFMDILSVSQEQSTGFVTIAIEHHSPTIAKQWIDWLVDDLNFSIMRQDVDEAEEAIEYLNEQIKNTSLADLQGMLFSLIEEQTKTIMLANVNDEYLLKTIDPAVAPEKKSKPMRFLIVFIFFLLGFAAAITVVFVSQPTRRDNAE